MAPIVDPTTLISLIDIQLTNWILNRSTRCDCLPKVIALFLCAHAGAFKSIDGGDNTTEIRPNQATIRRPIRHPGEVRQEFGLDRGMR
jgi:hypothetical protein